jgi:hypothetical protein
MNPALFPIAIRTPELRLPNPILGAQTYEELRIFQNRPANIDCQVNNFPFINKDNFVLTWKKIKFNR